MSRGLQIASRLDGRGKCETIMLPGRVPLEMMWIPAGTFMMGSPVTEQGRCPEEGPQHQVTFSQGFWLGKYILTKEQWTAVMGTMPWSGPQCAAPDPLSPAVNVSWNDIQIFISALIRYTGLSFRLPSEAEWEYACRAGTITRFYWGEDPNCTVIDGYEWWGGNTHATGELYAHAVGQKLPNAWGLYDMSGNVAECCGDCWRADYEDAAKDGSPWMNSPRRWIRVTRGSSWRYIASYYRSAHRGHVSAWAFYDDLGFRLAR